MGFGGSWHNAEGLGWGTEFKDFYELRRPQGADTTQKGCGVPTYGGSHSTRLDFSGIMALHGFGGSAG